MHISYLIIFLVFNFYSDLYLYYIQALENEELTNSLSPEEINRARLLKERSLRKKEKKERQMKFKLKQISYLNKLKVKKNSELVA